MSQKEPIVLRFVFNNEDAFADIVFRDSKQATNAINAVLKTETGFLKLKNKERVPAIVKTEQVLAVYPLSLDEDIDDQDDEDEEEDEDSEGDEEE
jgi:hypothetical protein